MFGDKVDLHRGTITAFPDPIMSTAEDYIQVLNATYNSLVRTSQSFQQQVIQARLDSSPVNPTTLQVGTYVLAPYPLDHRPPTKFHSAWIGPFIILEVQDSGNTYVSQHVSTLRIQTFHISDLKLYRGSTDMDMLTTLGNYDSDETVIDRIIKHQYTGHQKYKFRLSEYDL